MTGSLRAIVRALLLLVAMPAWATTDPDVAKQDGAATPVQVARTLQLTQDQIAAGSIRAHASQNRLLAVLESRLTELPSETWRESKNIRAAVVFTLSGGSPKILRKILSLGITTQEDISLTEGALAYVEGKEDEARKALDAVDKNRFPALLSAQIALVQSALVVRTDPRRSLELLDLVRLQAPGTLLEEAALRRQVFVSSQLGDRRKFEHLTAQYLRRYRHSIYAGNFRQRLASVLAQMDFGTDPMNFQRIGVVLDDLDLEAKRDLYLLMAKSAIEQGMTKSAVLAARRVLDLPGAENGIVTRAKLYLAAAMIVSPSELPTGINELQRLDRSTLAADDIALLETALAVARQIQIVPDKPMSSTTPSAAPAQAAKQAEGVEMLSSITKAQDALKQVDKLIKPQNLVKP